MSPAAPSGLFHLDARLASIAREVPACSLAADIGADHGKLACWLMLSGRVERMIVSDLSPVSRDKARDLFVRHGLMDRVSLSAADGLLALREPAGAIIIAGMGGGLVARILRQPVDLGGSRLILSAHTELPLVRDALQDRGYAIVHEKLVRAAARYYRVITAQEGRQRLAPRERLLGVRLRAEMGASLAEYYRWQLRVAASWRGERGHTYRSYLQEALHEATALDRPGCP
ncbi:MAG: SAM-dependent methyltransferase [Clostridiales bacterium]|nr:SAM-dependent methyltransferase [Clostridiales bacterium]